MAPSAVPTARPTLDSSVRRLPGIGPVEGQRLQKLGIETVRDLLFHLPSDWVSYGELQPVGGLRPNQNARVAGTLLDITARVSPRQRRQLAEARLQDDAGGILKIVWFNQPYLTRYLRKGQRVVVAGVARPSRYAPGFEMQNPKHEVIGSDGEAAVERLGALLPTYPLTKGLSSLKVKDWVAAALPLADELVDPLPAAIRERHRLLRLPEAIRRGHEPTRRADWERARDRLAWQELFELQIGFLQLRRLLAAEHARPIRFDAEVGDRFKAGLGFALTRAQREAARAVFRDLELDVPMNRLLNGDVGSGKTAVAAAAVAMTHAAGMQSVVMAPTEILARQHLHKFRNYLEGSFPGLTVELLVSGLPAAESRRVRVAAASGHCALVVGTHALIEETVEFAQLGLAVVDEQHRFGTGQRERLRAKGLGQPHFLAMTATPIPRTLALARYGEMALSILDELPPGRTPVVTRTVVPDERQKAYELVRQEVRSGRQAFIICPLIEESETTAARAATAEFERLRSEVFPELRLGLVHGRVKDKDAVMAAFAAGSTDVLVATAVVEVGVDVPNATVMIIEGAERFGLAQLHQFRGRVGRGQSKSYCLLLADEASDKALHRLLLMQEINDGFRLAEEDMRLRGAGELLGRRQHGLTDEAMAMLTEPRLLDEIRDEAERLVAEDPELAAHPLLRRAVDSRLRSASLS